MAADPDILLVATHPRSGTHLCINALCLNVRDVQFRLLRGQYPTLERIVMDHDADYTREFDRYLHGGPGTKIVKTHLRPCEIRAAMERDGLLSGDDLRLFQEIAASARRVHVYRDGRDVMLSWYRYMKDYGGGLPSDLPPRLAGLTFPEFLRMPNKFLPILRGFGPEDATRPGYWAAYVDEWAASAAVVQVAFETLRRDFEGAVRSLAAALGLRERLIEPLEPPPVQRAATTLAGRCVRAVQKRMLAARHRARGVRSFPPSSAYAQKGAVGGWRAQFSAEDRAFFLQEAGAALKRLGYED